MADVYSIHEQPSKRPVPTPTRHPGWRGDWQRLLYRPTHTQDPRLWEVLPMNLLAIHTPSETGFELGYGPHGLLRSIEFLRAKCNSAAREWRDNGPELGGTCRPNRGAVPAALVNVPIGRKARY